uniref:Uncharacterized protein n=1 Tax=Anguilla anguilla TaxID=7936 RepID=A0A0E9RSX6_ANGAN
MYGQHDTLMNEQPVCFFMISAHFSSDGVYLPMMLFLRLSSIGFLLPLPLKDTQM